MLAGSTAAAEASIIPAGGPPDLVALAAPNHLEMEFEVVTLVPQGPTTVERRGVDASGVVPFVKQLSLGVYAVRARLVDNRYLQMVPPRPVAVLVVTEVLGATVYTLSDLLALLIGP